MIYDLEDTDKIYKRSAIFIRQRISTICKQRVLLHTETKYLTFVVLKLQYNHE
jgi:hypothetical protein